jgi:hypothetical protein
VCTFLNNLLYPQLTFSLDVFILAQQYWFSDILTAQERNELPTGLVRCYRDTLSHGFFLFNQTRGIILSLARQRNQISIKELFHKDEDLP